MLRTAVEFHSEFRSTCRTYVNLYVQWSEPALKPGWVIRVIFSPGHPGLTWFTIYPGLKRNCSFDDVETYKCYHVAFREPRPLIALPTYARVAIVSR